MLISKTDSSLLIIDVQGRLTPMMCDARRVIDGCSRLLKGAGVLGIPTVITEQYPKGLGHSMFDIRDAAPQTAVYFEKTSFSAVREEGFTERLKNSGRKQIVIAGVEEHICVFQTAVDLKKAGFDVFVVTDASGCRFQENEKIAASRLKQEGVYLVSVEMVLFEWLEKAGSPEFKEIQNKLIK